LTKLDSLVCLYLVIPTKKVLAAHSAHSQGCPPRGFGCAGIIGSVSALAQRGLFGDIC
jgi:hypothetical protein